MVVINMKKLSSLSGIICLSLLFALAIMPAVQASGALVLTPIGNQLVNELSTLTFTATATGGTTPLAYSLVGAPSGASINSSTGVFTWTPTEAQGPGNYIVRVRVTDSGTPVMFAEETIMLSVVETNVAPVLAALTDRTIKQLQAVTFTATATDADLPANTLTFTLVDAPIGATINATTGVFTWTPTVFQEGVKTFKVRVSDGMFFDEKTIRITVTNISAPVITLKGENPMTIIVGGTYTEMGANVVDNYDVGLIATITGTVNTSETRIYAIRYNVTDRDGNAAVEVVRTVYVVDAPVKRVLSTIIGRGGYTLDGKTYDLTALFKNENGDTLMPIRMLEGLGAELAWNDATKTATFTYKGKVVLITAGSSTAIVNGSPVAIIGASGKPVPAVIVNGRMMVALRFVSETLGFNVQWSSTNGVETIVISEK
ncbi:MAG: stalk domain-containing protein [bacterium]|nr:stalk domain-containing protein [bacterium]